MKTLFSPIQEFTRGVKAFPRGVVWLKHHPRYLFLLMLPSVLSVFLLWGLWGQILNLSQWFVGVSFFEKPSFWGWLIFWWIGWFFVSSVPIILCVLGVYLGMKVIASPIFDWVSIAIEKDLTGFAPPALSTREQITVIFGELKKALIILLLPILLLLIPGFNVISLPVAAFLTGWDFFDYPLARRGWSFKKRWRFVAGELWSVMGFGLWFVIPFVNILFAPFAIAGGTVLGVECLTRHSSE